MSTMKKKRPALNDTVMRALCSAMYLVSQDMVADDYIEDNPCAKDWARAIKYVDELDKWYREKNQKNQKDKVIRLAKGQPDRAARLAMEHSKRAIQLAKQKENDVIPPPPVGVIHEVAGGKWSISAPFWCDERGQVIFGSASSFHRYIPQGDAVLAGPFDTFDEASAALKEMETANKAARAL